VNQPCLSNRITVARPDPVSSLCRSDREAHQGNHGIGKSKRLPSIPYGLYKIKDGIQRAYFL
jgi:hypothetical protein